MLVAAGVIAVRSRLMKAVFFLRLESRDAWTGKTSRRLCEWLVYLVLIVDMRKHTALAMPYSVVQGLELAFGHMISYIFRAGVFIVAYVSCAAQWRPSPPARVSAREGVK